MKTPTQEFYDDDGNLVANGADAIAALDADIAPNRVEHRAALSRMSPEARRGYLRTRQLPQARSRAPREAHNDRPRGSRRSSVRRSSERSGDSGEDGPSDEPPSRRRLCAFCGKNIPANRAPQATYCSDKHADRDRQRRKRTRDRARNKLPADPMPADFWRMCEFAGPVAAWSVGPARHDWVYPASGRHSQSFRFPELGEYEALREAARARIAREGVAA